MKSTISHKSTAVIIYFLCGFLLFSQSSPFISPIDSGAEVPESSEIRRRLESWIHAPVNEARAESPGLFRQSVDGRMVRVRSDETEDFFYQLFLIEKDFSYPVAGRGNFIIKRDKSDGSYVQVKIFMRDDAGSFIRIFPSEERTVMDLYLLGRKIYSDVVLPYSLSQVFTTPLSGLMAVTGARIDWSVYDPPPAFSTDRQIPSIIKEIRSHLLDLYDCDDGAMDRNGNYIYIETLGDQDVQPGGFNCSGFVKWVADGYYGPLTGELMDIPSLKEKHNELRGNSWSDFSEEDRDPFFGLDWTRNIAVALEERRSGGHEGTGSPDFESADVREVSFFSYTEDIGWKVAELESVLYLLAKNEPGNFYLGSLNHSWGEEQVLRQHTHVVALFPYFTPLGEFKTAVFERNRETSLESLGRRYEDDHIHLVRIGGEGEFRLPHNPL